MGSRASSRKVSRVEDTAEDKRARLPELVRDIAALAVAFFFFAFQEKIENVCLAGALPALSRN